MTRENAVSRASIERQDGFLGINGLFRFRQDGSVERALAILRVVGDGSVEVIEPGAKRFAGGS